ncbi:hypothetical protein MTR67_042980 [Solanum verrucosum]|uniref:Uncharacterized protein n=1 Tax=Solanum verrucosum TaxID=315347 RepID=A0AAF0ZU87_SOLVR|nr:hypothetical protein MTR67_042980 [Solanum verrucosum]
MDNRVYFRFGGKSYDITKFRSKGEVWYDWVESARHHTRRMVLSRGALDWVCKRLTEASEIREKADKSWRCRDFSTNFFIAEVWYDWVESARNHMRRMVLSRGALGWVCKRLTEASEIRDKADKSWRCRDFSTNFFIALKFDQ